MRNPQTLFIVGAGASEEAGLPIGKRLVDIIAGKLDFEVERGILREGTGDFDIIDALQQKTQTREGINTYLQAAWRVRDGIIFSNSIDSFIDVHRDDEGIQLCGKLAIAKTVLEAERSSKLFIDKPNGEFADLDGLKNTWFFDFARHLNEGVRKPEIGRIFEKVSFVVFNYDRCFEHFMYQTLRRHYGVSESEAASTMKTLAIFHPYGTIGELPWESPGGIPFGFSPNRAAMQFMVSRIKTYTERVEEREILLGIREAVKKADTLVFLGFSYHPENMKLLSPGEGCNTERVFGTAFGISDSNLEVIADQIRQMVGRKLSQTTTTAFSTKVWEPIYVHNNLTCRGLLQEYSRSLFAAG
jgi:hypothetical protein